MQFVRNSAAYLLSFVYSPSPKTEPTSPSPAPVKHKDVSSRQRVADELLITERNYVAYLRAMKNVYVDGLSKHKTVTKDDIKVIFGCMEVICKFSEVLLESLETRMASFNDQSTIGDILLPLVAFIKVYTQYCANFDEAMQRLKTSSDIKSLLMALQLVPECKGQSIESMLIMPVQRPPRYMLLLNELLKRTPSSHADFEPLTKALAEVTAVCQFINEQTKDAEAMKKVFRVNALLGGLDGLLQPHRRHIAEGQISFRNARAVPPSRHVDGVPHRKNVEILWTDRYLSNRYVSWIRPWIPSSLLPLPESTPAHGIIDDNCLMINSKQLPSSSPSPVVVNSSYTRLECKLLYDISSLDEVRDLYLYVFNDMVLLAAASKGKHRFYTQCDLENSSVYLSKSMIDQFASVCAVSGCQRAGLEFHMPSTLYNDVNDSSYFPLRPSDKQAASDDVNKIISLLLRGYDGILCNIGPCDLAFDVSGGDDIERDLFIITFSSPAECFAVSRKISELRGSLVDLSLSRRRRSGME